MLHLNYREVAQANIDQFDRLGAFRGETDCLYHYFGEDDEVTNIGCAIGIMDAKNELLHDNDISIGALFATRRDLVTVDNLSRLLFIQALHDFRTGRWPDNSFTARCASTPISIPDCVLDLVREIRKPGDLTPELYKKIMARLAAEKK